MKTTAKTPHNREFGAGISNLQMLISNKSYRKIVHVRGSGTSAALFFYIQDSTKKWVPWTGSDYVEFDEFSFDNLPDLIKRHIDVYKLQEMQNAIAMGDSSYVMGLHFENGEVVSWEK